MEAGGEKDMSYVELYDIAGDVFSAEREGT